MSIIQIEGLQKNYGKHRGIKDVSFSVNQGEIFGFVGPNGAGKSTTIKTLLGFIFATSGQASICGLDVALQSKAIKSFTGYVPSDVRLYSNMRVQELLHLNGDFYDLDCKEESKRLCQIFEVDTGKYFRELSTGNKKKVSIVCALMAKPKVIILDEPTNGLDPVMQKKLFEELQMQTKKGGTVLLSSHNLAEVQEYCQRVAFIKEGEILTVTDLTAAQISLKTISVQGGDTIIPQGFSLLKVEKDWRIFSTDLEGIKILAALEQIKPKDFLVEKRSMEDQFWDLYKEENE